MEAVLEQNLNDTQIIICLLAHLSSFFVAVWFLFGFLTSTEVLNVEIVIRSYFSILFSLDKKISTLKRVASFLLNFVYFRENFLI